MIAARYQATAVERSNECRTAKEWSPNSSLRKSGAEALWYVMWDAYNIAEAQCVRGVLEAKDVIMEIDRGIGLISTLCALRVGPDKGFHQREEARA